MAWLTNAPRYHHLDHLVCPSSRGKILALPPMKAATECNSLAPYRHLEQGEKVTSRHHLTTYVLRFLNAAEPSALNFGPIVDVVSMVFNLTFLTTVICRRQIPTTNFISRSTVSSHTNHESEIQQTRVFASSNVTSRNAK